MYFVISFHEQRFKEDKSEVKNSFVMPTLGIEITYNYRKLALQIPLYYNAKTATADGRWNVRYWRGYKAEIRNNNNHK